MALFSPENFYSSLMAAYAFGFVIGAATAFIKNKLHGEEVMK